MGSSPLALVLNNWRINCFLRLIGRTSPFHGVNIGSNPIGSNLNLLFKIVSITHVKVRFL